MARIALDPRHDALGIIDVQPTFMPGGALPVPDGDAVIGPINRLLALPFGHRFATQDWHPADHASFARLHSGRAPLDVVPFPYGPQTLWPDHAIEGSADAALHPALDDRRIDLVLRKGTHAEVDSYSAFRENDRVTSTGLAALLRARGVRRVFLAGLALDVCVAFSAEDAAAEGFEAFVVEDASRAIAVPAGDGTTLDAARARARTNGIGWILLSDLEDNGARERGAHGRA